MKFLKFCIFVFLIHCFGGCKRKKVTQDRLCSRVNFEEIMQVIPKTSDEIYTLTAQIIERMNQTLDQVDQIDPEKRTYVNTLLAYEQAFFQFFMHKQIFILLSQLSTDSGIQTAANVGLLELMQYESEKLDRNEIWFQVMQEYEKFGKDPYRNIKPVNYFLNVQLEKGLRYGLNLDVEKLAQISHLQQEIKFLAAKFYSNIMHDQKYVVLPLHDSCGVNVSLLDGVSYDCQGNIKIPVNQKNYDLFMKTCNLSSLRRDFFQAFYNRGYPHNEKILLDIHELYNQMAKQLQFDTLAEMQLDDCMVHNPKKLETFLFNFNKDLEVKAAKSINMLKQRLPYGVSLNPCGQFMPWDFDYVCSVYEKSYFDIDDTNVALYFPVETVCNALLKQFGTFFHVTFELQKDAEKIWAPDVLCYRVRSLKHQGVIGYLFLDLYKRFAKRDVEDHAMILIPAIRDDCSIPCVGASVVITQFEPAQANQPTVMTFDQLYSLTYQLGVAFHNIFGATRFTQFSGNQVPPDFMHTSSELLCHWLMQPNFLQLISSHVTTQKHIDKRTAEKLIARAKFRKIFNTEQTLFLSLVALKFFDTDISNVNKSINQIHSKIFPYLALDKQTHFMCSFDSLVNVDKGALVYAPLWSSIIAADCFEEIKKTGLLNHETGMNFVTEVLGHGASKHPVDMIKRFLGRSVHKSVFINQL